MEFTVKRSEWLRGTGRGELMDAKGKKCCLGFFALACGYTPKEIRGKGTTAGLAGAAVKCGVEYCYPDGYTPGPIWSIATTNDSVNITDAEREYELTEKFAALGDTVHFVD